MGTKNTEKKAGGLKGIDNAAEEKGSLIVTIWQFVKFIVVSLLAMIVQFSLLNILKAIPAIQALSVHSFKWFVFDYPFEGYTKIVEYNDAGEAVVIEKIIFSGLALFIAANVANIVAQIVAFFVNKEKTFNSGANLAIALPIYIVFTIALVVFSAWLNPTLYEVFIGWKWDDTLAINVATMICSAVQFFLYFPVDKILFHKKKEEK